jgi:hypothetical protein
MELRQNHQDGRSVMTTSAIKGVVKALCAYTLTAIVSIWVGSYWFPYLINSLTASSSINLQKQIVTD